MKSINSGKKFRDSFGRQKINRSKKKQFQLKNTFSQKKRNFCFVKPNYLPFKNTTVPAVQGLPIPLNHLHNPRLSRSDLQ